MNIEFGIYLNGIGIDYEVLKARWLRAEETGFDFIWMMDNVVGPVPYLPEEPVMDTWTVLPALAETTKRAKFGTLVTPYGRRRPAVVAKSATILDHISNGRFHLGMGPGDEERQHIPWGQEFGTPAERIAQLREELTIIRSMFQDDKTSFEGKYCRVEEALNFPKPVQKPNPPIWIGLVFGKQLMPKLAGEFADGINFYHADDVHVAEMKSIAEQRVRENGRAAENIMFSRNIGVTITDKPIVWDEFVADKATEAQVPTEYMHDYYNTYECHVAGTEAEVARGIVDRVLRLGIEQPIIQFGHQDHDSMRMDLAEAMGVFQERIAPRVRDMASDLQFAGPQI
jgi:alkanesulfonate monooxygenase SsuD/methylene tetrahydromethanopterin reductase-like flavin-dependent oxidoreductase (luciferase family)